MFSAKVYQKESIFLTVKENFTSDDRQLVNTFNTFNTFFSNIAVNLKVKREKTSHEKNSNNPDRNFNSIERHQNHPRILRIEDMMQQKRHFFFPVHNTRDKLN